MRTIKFRGKIEHTNEWVQGYYFETPLTDGKTDSMPEDGWSFLTGKKRHVISRNSCVYQVNPETVCQFTDLFDKNGVEIYENDIIRKHNYRNGEYIEDYIVVFDYGSYCLKTIRDNEIHPKGTLISFGNFEYNGNLRKEYIIGNIFDNPELL